jgi:hypothetical protein
MKRILLCVLITVWFGISAQTREISPVTLQQTYTGKEIHKSLRDIIDNADKASYFNDEFFGSMLRKLVTDRQFTESEKVKLFYLMQKKAGYAFTGVQYIPPKQNYFAVSFGKNYSYEQTRKILKDLSYDVRGLLKVVDDNLVSDPLLASNALLLSAMLGGDSTMKKLETISSGKIITASKNPSILNHYVCITASLIQNEKVSRNLKENLKTIRQEEMLEDILCALYSKNNPVSGIREYILSEKDPRNDLAIQTALNVLAEKVPPASYKQSVTSLIAEAGEKWKADLLKKMLENKIPFNYSLSNPEILVTKAWDGVTVSQYSNGTLITNGNLTEFDPN